METLGTGIPRTEFSLVDNSVITIPQLKGVTAFLGITERGAPSTPILCKSWEDYVANFGGLVSYSLFPLYMKRFFDAGGVARISRIGHYTDIDDAGTFVGVAATIEITNGLTTGSERTAIFTAANPGSWGNRLTVTIAQNVNDTDAVNITLAIDSITKTLTIKKAPTAPQIEAFNANGLVIISGIVNGIFIGSDTLEGGTEDYEDISDEDIAGSIAANNGIHAFDSFTDCVRICVPEHNTTGVETALAAYVLTRLDMLALHPEPVGINGETIVAYRARTTPYNGEDVINEFHNAGWWGDIVVNNPLTSTQVTISAVADVLGLMSRRDQIAFPWLAVGGEKFGQIRNVVSVPYDLGSPALLEIANSVSNNRLNYLINSNPYPLVWENNTLQKDETLLKHLNIAELIIHMFRGIKPLTKAKTFLPNDPQTWKELYRSVKSFMGNLNANRAFQSNGDGDGEGSGWFYQGDQNVDEVSQAVINNTNDVDNGIYKFRLFCKPVAALKYLLVEVVVNNSSVVYTVQEAN